jgi:hypothetical protein
MSVVSLRRQLSWFSRLLVLTVTVVTLAATAAGCYAPSSRLVVKSLVADNSIGLPTTCFLRAVVRNEGTTKATNIVITAHIKDRIFPFYEVSGAVFQGPSTLETNAEAEYSHHWSPLLSPDSILVTTLTLDSDEQAQTPTAETDLIC